MSVCVTKSAHHHWKENIIILMKVLKWQHSSQPLTRIFKEWRHFRFADACALTCMQRLYQGSENTIQFSYGGCISLRSISLITVQAGYIMTNFVQIPTISALYPQYQSPFVNSRLICLLALSLVHWKQNRVALERFTTWRHIRHL